MENPLDRVFGESDMGVDSVALLRDRIGPRMQGRLLNAWRPRGSWNSSRREAPARLATHNSPDAAVVADPLFRAKTLDTYDAALNVLETKLSAYLGRKQAIKLLAGLHP